MNLALYGEERPQSEEDRYALTLDLGQIKDILSDSNVKIMQLKTEYDKFTGN